MMRRCMLCASADQVTVQLLEWVQPHGTERWAYGDRCRDRKACRRRVEAAGHEWLVRDGMEPMVRP